MTTWRADTVSGVLLAVLGAAMAIMSLDYQLLRSGGRIGPGFVPGFAGLALVLLGAAIAVRAVRAHRGATDARQPVPDTVTDVAEASAGAEPVPGKAPSALPSGELPRNLRSTLTVLVIIVLTVYLTPRLGFLGAFWLLLAGILLLVEREPVWRGLLIASATTFIAWLVFDYALAVPLPAGILG